MNVHLLRVLQTVKNRDLALIGRAVKFRFDIGTGRLRAVGP